MIKTRSRTTPKKAVRKESTLLVEMATRLSQACCRAEDQYWDVRLSHEVTKLLANHDEIALSGALDRVHGQNDAPYGTLIETIESCAESTDTGTPNQAHVVLIAIPVLAWSRFPIPTGKLGSSVLDALRAQLHGHILARDVRVCLADFLFSPDQLPQSFSKTYEFLQQLVPAAVNARNHSCSVKDLPETVTFMSDTRYILGAVAITKGAALFRWQEEDINPTLARQHWQQQARDALIPAFPGCSFEIQSPSAYHHAIREADRAARPHSIDASVNYLRTILACDADALQATIGAYHDRQLEEYRIGFARAGKNEVLHGVVWPIIDPEDESPETIHAIENLVKSAGIQRVNVIRHQLPAEFCDDCDAPLFPNSEGEPTHAELPESVNDNSPQHLH